MTEMLKKFLSFMNLTVSNTYFKLMFEDIFVILCSVNISCILETLTFFSLCLHRAQEVILVFNTERPFVCHNFVSHYIVIGQEDISELAAWT